MAEFPLDPQLAKMLVASPKYNCRCVGVGARQRESLCENKCRYLFCSPFSEGKTVLVV